MPAPGNGAVLATRGDAGDHAPALRRECRRRAAGLWPMARRSSIGDGEREAGAGRPCPRQRAGGAGIRRQPHRRLAATTSAGPTRPARPSSRSPAMSSSPRRPSRLPVFRHPADGARDRQAAAFAAALSRAHAIVVGAYALGKCQRVIALLRRRARTSRSSCTARCSRSATLYEKRGVALGAAAAGARRDARTSSGARSCSRRLRRVGRPLGAALAGPGRRAWPRAGCGCAQRAKAARRRAAAGDLRSCRLGRADRDDRRGGATRSGSRMAARRRCCAKPALMGYRRARAVADRLRGRGIGDETASPPLLDASSSRRRATASCG